MDTIKTKGVYALYKSIKDGKPVVLKTLKRDYVEKPQYQKLLQKEYDTWSKLDNPHLVKYLDFIDDADHGHCIVEEYVDGRSLNDYLQENHTTDEKMAIIEQIADALEYLHGRDVLHRNLKASNIIIAKGSDAVKIIDVRVPFADDLHVAYSSMVHVAPEQKDGSVALDGRADIYAFGVLLKGFGLSAAKEPVINKCCSYSRGDRYMDISSVMADLDHSGETSSKKPKIIIGAIIAAVIVAAVAVINFTSKGEPSESGQDAVEATADSSSSEQTATPATDAAAPESATADTTQMAPGATDAATADGQKQFTPEKQAQMQKDLDAMFQPYLDGTNANRAQLNRRIKRYYTGLLRTFGHMDAADRAAYDKAFGYYVKQKKSQLPQ